MSYKSHFPIHSTVKKEKSNDDIILLKILKRCENAFTHKFKINDEDILYNAVLDIILKYKKNKTNIRNFDMWLNGAIHNHFRTYLRQKKSNKEFFFEHGDCSEIIDEQKGESSLGSTELFSLLKRLEGDQLKVVEYRLYHNLSHKEIAQKLDSSLSNVRTMYSRGINKLSRIMGAEIVI